MAYLMAIDDDEDFAEATAMVLRDAGHEVEIKLDIESAVKSMEERRPDLVILDVMFPKDNTGGITLARTMQLHNEKLKGIPVIVLSAVNVKYPYRFLSKYDIDEHWFPVIDFLEKPVDPDALRDKVSEVLEAAALGAGEEGKVTRQ